MNFVFQKDENHEIDGQRAMTSPRDVRIGCHTFRTGEIAPICG
jgi:hypothetical protein